MVQYFKHQLMIFKPISLTEHGSLVRAVDMEWFKTKHAILNSCVDGPEQTFNIYEHNLM